MAAYQHGGDIYRNQVDMDFSINVNPLGVPVPVREAFIRSADALSRYPDSEAMALTGSLAAHHGMPEGWILCGNGCADLIFQLSAALKPRRAVVPAPTFSEYEAALDYQGCEVLCYELRREREFALEPDRLIEYLRREAGKAPIDLLFLCNPNNPTGTAVRSDALRRLLAVCRELGIFVAVDECFMEFVEDGECCTLLGEVRDNAGVMILKAFTKTYALAGLRLGYALCSDPGVLAAMKAGRQPWSVSIPAQQAGCAALAVTGYLEAARELIGQERKYLSEALSGLGFAVYPSDANYLLFYNPREEIAALGEWCRQQGILIRSCGNYPGLTARDYRICVKTHQENVSLVKILNNYQSVCSG